MTAWLDEPMEQQAQQTPPQEMPVQKFSWTLEMTIAVPPRSATTGIRVPKILAKEYRETVYSHPSRQRVVTTGTHVPLTTAVTPKATA